MKSATLLLFALVFGVAGTLLVRDVLAKPQVTAQAALSSGTPSLDTKRTASRPNLDQQVTSFAKGRTGFLRQRAEDSSRHRPGCRCPLHRKDR